MKYKSSKHKYIQTIIILAVGILSLSFLGSFIKSPGTTKNSILKPHVTISPSGKFLYVANTIQGSVVNIFDTQLSKNTTVYSTSSAENISYGSLVFNSVLYLHGMDNLGISIKTQKLFPSYGDYISPDGKKFITLSSLNSHNNTLTFTVRDENNNIENTIMSKNLRSQVASILGWSSDSRKFYYTTKYSITHTSPMQATDHWMQKINGVMQPMSRVRTWIQYSTSSAQLVYQVNLDTNVIAQPFINNLGPLSNIYYDNYNDRFYLENNEGIYAKQVTAEGFTRMNLESKIATATVAMVFNSQNDTDTFLHSDGKALSIYSVESGIDRGIYYASQSGTLTPLALVGSNVIFSLQYPNHYTGEIIDMARLTRQEFIYQNDNFFLENFPQPIYVIAWLKDITVSY